MTHADPQAQVHLRNGSATSDGTAAQASEARKRQHYARPGHVSFDERSFKLTTLAVEIFGRLEEEGYEFIDEQRRMLQGGEMEGRWPGKESTRRRFRSFRWLRRWPYQGGSTIQAHTTWATRNGRPKNKIHIEHINTINELGM